MPRPPLPLVALIVLPIAACSDLAGSAGSPFAGGVEPTALARSVPADRALASLAPQAGAVVSVDERREEKGWVQTVTLAGGPATTGSNAIRIEALPRGAAVASRVRADVVEAELATDFPGIDMRILPQAIATGAGPVAAATGVGADGTRCILAWRALATGAEDVGFESLLRADRPAYALRVRLCGHGVSEERLIADVSGLQVRSDLMLRRGGDVVARAGDDALASAARGSAASVVPAMPERAVPAVAATGSPARRTAAARPASTGASAPVVAAAAKADPGPAKPPAAPAIVANPIPLPSGS